MANISDIYFILQQKFFIFINNIINNNIIYLIKSFVVRQWMEVYIRSKIINLLQKKLLEKLVEIFFFW